MFANCYHSSTPAPAVITAVDAPARADDLPPDPHRASAARHRPEEMSRSPQLGNTTTRKAGTLAPPPPARTSLAPSRTEEPDSCRFIFRAEWNDFYFPPVLAQSGCKISMLTGHPNSNSNLDRKHLHTCNLQVFLSNCQPSKHALS